MKWLALLCTDLSLPDKEVVRIYGNRWDIDVFFQIAKHYLKLDSEKYVRDFDSILAHSSTVMIRYIFLAVEHTIRLGWQGNGNPVSYLFGRNSRPLSHRSAGSYSVAGLE